MPQRMAKAPQSRLHRRVHVAAHGKGTPVSSEHAHAASLAGDTATLASASAEAALRDGPPPPAKGLPG